ncbi:uncharacterized protein N7483_001821 [Penicillium malachiteum]|uniref:uncharacterized protein n=1 Tax=Penicillium malachiteum TaxID=1324776 RepID=UPI00254812E0|nr:uncharacterized protein N7483_001821 [Penicillium malachiteum]KAJ5736696.1 hypothetical protein N7483_001821 [Penicillium malachiteum]
MSSVAPFLHLWRVDDIQEHLDGFIETPYRVGGPILCGLSLAHHSLHNNVDQDLQNRIIHMAGSILDRKHIEFLQLMVVDLQSLHHDDDICPTVFVVVADKPADALAKARLLHDAIRVFLPGNCVEIISALMLKPLQSFPVAPSEPILPKWPEISVSILGTLDLRDIVSLGCWRFGPEDTADKNRTTIVVGVYRGSGQS